MIPNTNTNYIINKYIIHGAYSKIYSGFYKNKKCVIKKIKNDVYRPIEYDITSKTNTNSNLLSAYNIYYSNNISIIFPYYKNGDFLEFIKKDIPIPEYKIKKYTYQILKCIHNVNEIGHVHLDIKLENFLLDDNFGLVLADFGSANLFLQNNNQKNYLSYRAGTNMYMSPEIGRSMYSNKSDIWSAGICLYLLLSCNPLYRNINDHKHTKIYIKKYSDDINDLLNKMLTPNIKHRISCIDALNHRCFT